MPSMHIRTRIVLLLSICLQCPGGTFAFTPLSNNCEPSGATASRRIEESPSPSPSLDSEHVLAVSRRVTLQSLVLPSITAVAALISPKQANAAPPIAVIAEELGYFPITNRQGVTQYIPAKVKRSSTDQSIELAKYLSSRGAIMYGTYWCGHTSHQKELFGREAWGLIQYVECSPKGAYYDSGSIEKVAKYIDGFPTWYIPNGGAEGKKGRGMKNEWISGEMPLERIASLSGYKGEFNVQFEGPDVGSAGSC